MDMVFGVTRMPRPGETVRAVSYERIPGGKGANQAYACGRLGGDCAFLSAVGQDALGDQILENLRTVGVATEDVAHITHVSTGVANILVDAAGENSIVVVAGANAACDAAYLKGKIRRLEESDIVLAQLETPVQDVCEYLIQAKRMGKHVILNPAPAPTEGTLPQELYPCLDYITPNETELERLTGHPTHSEEDIVTAARLLLEKGVGSVIVTMGAQGALLARRDGITVFPAFRTEAVDTTAAGDTFNAGLAVQLAAGRTLPEAIRFANAAAAISVTRKGAQTSVPAEEEVIRLLENAGRGTEGK